MFPRSLKSCILNVADRQVTSKHYVNVTHIFPRLALNNCIGKVEPLGGNISLEEINLLRLVVIIAFNLLRNRHISLLCMLYRSLLYELNAYLVYYVKKGKKVIPPTNIQYEKISEYLLSSEHAQSLTQLSHCLGLEVKF